jgi:hypothetical protein
MNHKVCVCGHAADDHLEFGFCEITDCKCERFRPSDDEGEAVA